jgi:hypothetical protein
MMVERVSSPVMSMHRRRDASQGSRIRSTVSDQKVEVRDDWVNRPGMGIVWWCLPIAIGVATSYLASSSLTTVLVWIVSFVWMGTGCILNARRCHRVHCYISGPTFFLGAAALGLFAAGIAFAGPHSLNNIVGITLTVALLSFVPEIIWKKRL